MAKKKMIPHIQNFKEAIEYMDIDDVVYYLTQEAVKRLDKANKGENDAEKKFCQHTVEVLNETQRKLEEI